MTAIATWCFSIVCLVGTVVNVKKIRYCFLFWIVGNACWLAYDLWLGLYSRALLDSVQLALAVWGWFSWKDDEDKCQSTE